MKLCAECYTGCRGTYAKVLPDFSTANMLASMRKSIGIDFQVEPDPHVTLMISNLPLKTTRLRYPIKPITAVLKEAQYWEEDGRSIAVLTVESNVCVHVHNLLSHAGAVHRYTPYRPHLTCGFGGLENRRIFEDWVIQANHYLKYRQLNLMLDRIIVRDLDF